MQKKTYRSVFHWLFELGVVMKGISGLVWLGCGIALLLVSENSLSVCIEFLKQFDPVLDPNGPVSTVFRHFVGGVENGSKNFGALYLISHAGLQLFLVYHLLKEHLWVFPLTIAFMEVFVLYQFYRVYTHHSLLLLAFTLWDVCVIGFIWKEYRIRRAIVTTMGPAC